MLTEMRLYIVINKINKFNKIQSSENHNLIIINLILINNLYFLNIMKDLLM